MKYSEPMFNVVSFCAQDVITTSGGAETSGNNSSYHPGHYDTPIIKI